MYGAKSGTSRVVALLPYHLRNEVETKWTQVEEIRLRVGRRVSVVKGCKEYLMSADEGSLVSCGDLMTVLEFASQSSVHTVLERVKQGFVTISGGHRIGICGNAVVHDGKVENYRYISSLSLRVAREQIGVARELVKALYEGSQLENTLILAPPGMGKTTVLRDLVRCLSDGDGVEAMRVGLADERGEVAATWEGVPQLDVGCRTDVMDGCTKHVGITMLLRGMNPQALAVDEIVTRDDVEAVLDGIRCGVKILATAHGNNISDIKGRQMYKGMLGSGAFSKIVEIGIESGNRTYTVSRV